VKESIPVGLREERREYAMILVSIVHFVFNIYIIGLIVYAISSWVQHPAAFQIRHALEQFYAPFLDPIRAFLRSLNVGGVGIDFSPMVLILIAIVLREVVISLLVGVL
jgi:uncharacterized protein YggT (Ycf19 family)